MRLLGAYSNVIRSYLDTHVNRIYNSFYCFSSLPLHYMNESKAVEQCLNNNIEIYTGSHTRTHTHHHSITHSVHRHPPRAHETHFNRMRIRLRAPTIRLQHCLSVILFRLSLSLSSAFERIGNTPSHLPYGLKQKCIKIWTEMVAICCVPAFWRTAG